MSLGPNDALGIPSSSSGIYPSKIRVTAPSNPAGINFATFATVTVNNGHGQIERVLNATLGDRFVIKQAGIYAITTSIIMTSLSGQVAVVKNVAQANAATNPLDITSFVANPQLADKVLGIWVANTASQRSSITCVTWLDSGDYVQLMSSQALTVGDDSQFFQVEKLYG